MKYFPILLMSSLLASTLQHKIAYRIKVTRAVVPRFNQRYGGGKVWISKPNRYTNAVNGEFYFYNIPQDTKVKVQMYEFLSNEYRPFAVNFERNLCSFLDLEYKMMFYPHLAKTGSNMPEPRCPVKPGNYSFANVTADDANFPADVPFRNLLLELSYWTGTVEMGALQFYATLDRDAVIREQYT